MLSHSASSGSRQTGFPPDHSRPCQYVALIAFPSIRSALAVVGLSALATWVSYTWLCNHAVNLEGDYGKSGKCASAASCGAARSAVARRKLGPSDFSDRVATRFRIISPNKPTEANHIGGFTAENGAGAEGEMGECSKGIAASSNGRLSPSKGPYDVGFSPEKDRCGTAGTLGEDTSGEQESCVETTEPATDTQTFLKPRMLGEDSIETTTHQALG
jgi:hypothetical protein